MKLLFRSPVVFGDCDESRRREASYGPSRVLLFAAALALAGCTPEPLPEEGTASAALYVKKCGQCHSVYRPRLLTAKMWESMTERMEIQMRRRGVVMTPAEREEILAYLRRNAGDR